MFPGTLLTMMCQGVPRIPEDEVCVNTFLEHHGTSCYCNILQEISQKGAVLAYQWFGVAQHSGDPRNFLYRSSSQKSRCGDTESSARRDREAGLDWEIPCILRKLCFVAKRLRLGLAFEPQLERAADFDFGFEPRVRFWTCQISSISGAVW